MFFLLLQDHVNLMLQLGLVLLHQRFDLVYLFVKRFYFRIRSDRQWNRFCNLCLFRCGCVWFRRGCKTRAGCCCCWNDKFGDFLFCNFRSLLSFDFIVLDRNLIDVNCVVLVSIRKFESWYSNRPLLGIFEVFLRLHSFDSGLLFKLLNVAFFTCLLVPFFFFLHLMFKLVFARNLAEQLIS